MLVASDSRMKLSIIVPVYNAAATLQKFLQSLLAASDNVKAISDKLSTEIILVDDCSTDGSLKILESSVTLHSTLKLLHLPTNAGVSAARQAGLDMAQGEYVIFADPDDRVDPGMYEGLISAAEESGADLVFEDFFENDARRNQEFEGSAEDLICAILGRRIHGATWNKLIRRDFIVKSGARFCEDRLGLCEDVDFLCQILVKNPKVAYHRGCHYHYETVQGSATHGLSEKSFADLAKVGARLSKILTTPKMSDALLKWRKGNRFAASITKGISRHFLKSYEPDCRDLSGLPTNIIRKILFWIKVRVI